MNAFPDRCSVCHGPMTLPNMAECYRCRRYFHLHVRMNVPGTDCGQVWIDDEELSLVFNCQPCYETASEHR